jgi:hypothetical protein
MFDILQWSRGEAFLAARHQVFNALSGHYTRSAFGAAFSVQGI